MIHRSSTASDNIKKKKKHIETALSISLLWQYCVEADVVHVREVDISGAIEFSKKHVLFNTVQVKKKKNLKNEAGCSSEEVMAIKRGNVIALTATIFLEMVRTVKANITYIAGRCFAIHSYPSQITTVYAL